VPKRVSEEGAGVGEMVASRGAGAGEILPSKVAKEGQDASLMKPASEPGIPVLKLRNKVSPPV
jgi:hypothetical protein